MEVPLLFEAGIDAMCDMTVAVACGEKQYQRLAERTGMSESVKRAAIASQLSEAEKKKRADRVVDNSGTLAETAAQVSELWGAVAA